MFICMPKKHFIIHFFLGDYILGNPAIWLADSILIHNSRPRILPDMGWLVKNQKKKKLVFILDYLQENLITKFFKKFKNILWGHFGSFLPKLRKKWIFLVKRATPVFKYSNYLPLWQKSEKTNEPFLRKMQN